MLDNIGVCMGGLDAVEFLEMLPDNIPDEIKDDDFCDNYERMLNRVRYEVRQSIPVSPKVTEPVSKGYGRFYNCGQCGFSLRTDIYKHCPNCGREIKWSTVFPERWP